MAAVVVGSAIAMVLLQRFYVRAGRELRRLDMITRSPIYTLFSETCVSPTHLTFSDLVVSTS
jgi:hypothetical protein